MPALTIRLDEETKQAMKRIRDINWSEILRQKIREVLEHREKENRVKALLISQELSRASPQGYDSTKVIRFWRDRRHGPVRR